MFNWGSKPKNIEGSQQKGLFEFPEMMFHHQTERQRNHIYLYQDISQSTIHDFNMQFRDIEKELKQFAVQYDCPPPPIHVHIHSYGGSIFSGFAAMGAIESSELEVHTHIEGSAASAATLISVAGNHRTIQANSFLLIHQLSSEFWGKFEELKDQMENNDRIMKKMRNVYKKYTTMKAQDLNELLKRDLWMDAKGALEHGFVDKIV